MIFAVQISNSRRTFVAHIACLEPNQTFGCLVQSAGSFW